jgi:Novel Ras effector 1 C-terminal SARAH (Sav/Rassf/Hpo) domain
MRKLADNEVPLCMALQWSRDPNCGKMFVLQENDPGEIMVNLCHFCRFFVLISCVWQWEAFTYPELANFLRILDREEEEYKNVVRQKYKFLAHKIQEALDQIKPITTTEKREEQDESEVP